MHGEWGEPRSRPSSKSSRSHRPGSSSGGSTRPRALDLARRAPWLRGSFVDDSGYLLQRIQCLVIDLDGVRVAVDTCVGNDKRRANPGWNEQHSPFLADLEAAGFPADTIDAVVCTHLHVDHVGWNTALVDGPGVRHSRPPGICSLDPSSSTGRRRRIPMTTMSSATLSRPCTMRGWWTSWPSTIVVDGGSIRFDSTPGHTPGHVSVVVESAGERAVITGDMIHTPIQIADVALSSAFDFAPDVAAETRAKFLERYADDALVIGTHWGGPGAGRIVADRDGWTVEPVAASSSS